MYELDLKNGRVVSYHPDGTIYEGMWRAIGRMVEAVLFTLMAVSTKEDRMIGKRNG